MDDLKKRGRSEAVNWSATCGRLFDELVDRIEALECNLQEAALLSLSNETQAQQNLERADRLAAILSRVCEAAEWMQECSPSKTRWGLGIECAAEEWEAVKAAIAEAKKELGE